MQRPITDLQDKLEEIEQIIQEGRTICLTKDGCASMIAMSVKIYAELTEDICYISEMLADADREAAKTDVRYTHEEVFSRLREKFE